VESFRDDAERQRLLETYGLRIDPGWSSGHWRRDVDVTLTPDQLERVKNIYAVDLKYRFDT